MRFNPDKVVEIRTEFGMTLVQFAARLGVCAATVSNWERGKHQPSRIAIAKMEKITEQGGKQ
jgi:DNA-binding transcriptional regulator YiaG